MAPGPEGAPVSHQDPLLAAQTGTPDVARSRAKQDSGRVGSQFVWVAAGRVLAAVLQAATMLLLIRALQPSEFGFFAAIFGLLTVPQVFFDLGLPTLLMRDRAIDRSNGSVTAALKLNTRLASTLAGVLLITGIILAYSVDLRFWLLLPLALWAAAERSADTWLGVVLADGDARINTTNLVARRLVTVALFWLLGSVAGMNPMLAFSVSVAVAAMGSLVFAYLFVARRLPASDGSSAVSLLTRAYPYWINSVSAQAQNLDAAITSALAGPVQAGFYATAARLTNPLRILPASLAAVLLPVAARNNSRTLGKVVVLVTGASVVFSGVYLIIYLLIPVTVIPVLGADYAGAILPLQITAIGLVFASIAALVGAILQGVGLKHYVAIISSVSTGVSLSGVAAGALAYGAVGASVGLACGYVLQSMLLSARLTIFIARREENAA